VLGQVAGLKECLSTACNHSRYCSKECQDVDRAEHSVKCKELKEAKRISQRVPACTCILVHAINATMYIRFVLRACCLQSHFQPFTPVMLSLSLLFLTQDSYTPQKKSCLRVQTPAFAQFHVLLLYRFLTKFLEGTSCVSANQVADSSTTLPL
jgi:hypothetical protein